MAKHAQVRRRRSWRRAGLLLSGASVPLAWLMVAPADAAPVEAHGSHTAQVADSAEAWYADAPVNLCTTPLGCPPADVPSSPYPEDTLHVGVAGGRETARTYVVPDLAAIPYGATYTAGTMTLPVATGDEDGTSSPETAKLVACLTTKPVTDGTQGSTETPPKVDCETSAKASYDAKKSLFTVDLSPFLSAWSHGALPFGIALLPDPKAAQPTDAWHVAFNGRQRKGAEHISSVITFTPPAPLDTGGTTTGGVGTGGTTTTAPPPVDTGPPSTTNVPLPGSASQAAPDQPAPQVAPPSTTTQAQPAALSREYQYPLAFLLPLAMLVGAVFFARLFTRDATPRPVTR